jgi:outer membrane protein TolC
MMAKNARRRTDNVLTMPSIDAPTGRLAASGISEADIARRAFELYCARGRADGHDVDDWLTAERELRAANSTAA